MSDSVLMLEYHKRTDHARDGAELDSFLCNCRELFRHHDSLIWDAGRYAPYGTKNPYEKSICG